MLVFFNPLLRYHAYVHQVPVKVLLRLQGASQDNVSPVRIVLPEFLTAANLDSVMEEGCHLMRLSLKFRIKINLIHSKNNLRDLLTTTQPKTIPMSEVAQGVTGVVQG